MQVLKCYKKHNFMMQLKNISKEYGMVVFEVPLVPYIAEVLFLFKRGLNINIQNRHSKIYNRGILVKKDSKRWIQKMPNIIIF